VPQTLQNIISALKSFRFYRITFAIRGNGLKDPIVPVYRTGRNITEIVAGITIMSINRMGPIAEKGVSFVKDEKSLSVHAWPS